MEKRIFSIPDISCGHCVVAVKDELEEMEGVSTVVGNLDDKAVTVEWDFPATLDKILEKLDEINYPSN